MRLAAMRTLGIWLGLFATLAAFHAVARVSFDEFGIGITAAALLVVVPIAAVAMFLLRQPRASARTMSIAVVALLAVPATLQTWDGSEATLPLSVREREAFEHLKKSETFEMPLVGFAAVPSDGYEAMRTLGRSRHADAAFKKLVESGTIAGQLYGLIGVYRTDRYFFARAVERYAQRSDEVDVYSGCVMGPERVGALVHTGMAEGEYTRAFLETDFSK